MEKPTELKMLLESSLKRIFRATVIEILDQVEQTLSEYQGTIQKIQTENESLKRLLSAQMSAESDDECLLSSDGSEGDAAEQFSGSNWNNHPIISNHTVCMVSSSEETSFRKKDEGNLKESKSSPPFFLQMGQLEEELCVDKSSRITVPVKTVPNLEESGLKLVENESSEVTCDALTDVHQLHPSRPKHESRGSDHSVKVTVVSDDSTQEGHFIKIKEKEGEALRGNKGDGLSQPELKYAGKYQEADQKCLDRESKQDVEQEEGTFEENNSTFVAEEDTQEKSSNILCCPNSPKTCSQAALLNAQINTHSKRKPRSCNICGKSFRWATELLYHKHTHTGERPYGCNLCSKAYANPKQLSRHRRIHTGEKPYVCQQCGKTFRDSGNHLQHMKTHTGERPHCCTQCGKKFSSIGHLKAHYRIHTGERPYGCKQCSKSFSQGSQLKAHMRVHTGEKPYSCDECGKKFTRSNAVKLHRKTHM